MLMPVELYNLTVKSGNKKVGEKCAVVQASCSTCPTSCPFYFESLERGGMQGPCYGTGWPLGMFWNQLSRGKYGAPLDAVLDRVHDEVQCGQLIRYGDVGDLPGRGDKIDVDKMVRLSAAMLTKVAWCYTHKPLLGVSRDENRAALRAVHGGGLVVNLSAEGWKKPDALLKLRLGPVVTVLPRREGWRRDQTQGGVEIRRCPAEYSCVTCSTCGGRRRPICARWDREYVVGFSAHGRARRRVEQRIAEVEMGLLGWS